MIDRFLAFRDLDDDAKASWLSYLVAISLEAKKGYSSEYHPLHALLGTMLDIDVAAMWRPNAENFFDRVPKGACLAALTEVGGAELAARYAASKKQDLSKTCEKIFSGDTIMEEDVKERALSWIPEAMKFSLPIKAEQPAVSEPDDEADISEDDQAVADKAVDVTKDVEVSGTETADEEAAVEA